jgi:hypothetical protein
VLLAALSRPSYYLKSRDTQTALKHWLHLPMLYRIPRSLVTTGVRALGRLAFCDNYKNVRARLKKEIDALLDPSVLTTAEQWTGLGIRSNRPRVYIVSGLGGGTGGGMFLDLAYTIRALLRQAGYEKPDVVALLLLPPVDQQRTRLLTLGNVHAALKELIYYGSPGSRFHCQYLEDEAPVEEAAPPFGRCVLMPLGEETDEKALRRVVGLVGQYLYRDLCSPLGRAADLARAGLPSPAWESRGLYYQTFGIFQLSFPRQALFEIVGRRLCRRLLEGWISKDSKPVRERVQTWVHEQWAHNELGGDTFIEQLSQECRQLLGQAPESALQEVLQPLIDKYTPSGGSANGTQPASALPPRSPSRVSASGSSRPEIQSTEIAEALIRLEELLGDPAEDGLIEPRGTLVLHLHEAAEGLGQHWGQKLAELPVRLIEEPQFRLAGAEEAVRQLVAMIEQMLQNQEPLLKDLMGRSREAYDRLRTMAVLGAGACKSGSGLVAKVGGVLHRGRSSGPTTADVLELLRSYSKWRYQSLVLNQVACVFIALRGHLADEMREINSCRVRLIELQRMLEDPSGLARGARGSDHGRLKQTTPPGRDPSHPGKFLFPGNARDLAAAADEFLSRVGPEGLDQLDARMEAMLKERFTALVQVCLSEANVLSNVYRAMLDTAGAFAAELVPPTDAAAMFFDQHPDDEQATAEVSSFFDEARPESPGQKPPDDRTLARPPEFCVLLTPPGDAGDRFRELARQGLGKGELHSATGGPQAADDVLLYCERSHLALSDLEQLGPAAQNAYTQMNRTGHFTPHSRIDVDFTT